MSVLQSVHQDNSHLHLLLFFSPFTFCLSRLVPKFLSKRATSFSSLAFVAVVDRIIIVSCSLQIKVGLLSCTNLLVCSQNQSVHMFIALWHSFWFVKAVVSLTTWLRVLWVSVCLRLTFPPSRHSQDQPWGWSCTRLLLSGLFSELSLQFRHRNSGPDSSVPTLFLLSLIILPLWTTKTRRQSNRMMRFTFLIKESAE